MARRICGEIEMETQLADIGDPCYSRDSSSSLLKDVPVKNGTYICYSDFEDNRVA